MTSVLTDVCVTGRSAAERTLENKDDRITEWPPHSLGIQILETTSLCLVSRRNRPAKPQGGSRPASTAGLLAGHALSATDGASRLPERVEPDAYKDVEKTSGKHCRAIGIGALGSKRRVY